MPIPVICPSCKGRFQVSEKFAGKQGPCPKCKFTISIPKLDEQVKIHAPEEFSGPGGVAAKDAQGRAVLKPIAREKSRIQPIVLIAAAAAALVAVVAALLLRLTRILGFGSSWPARSRLHRRWSWPVTH